MPLEALPPASTHLMFLHSESLPLMISRVLRAVPWLGVKFCQQ